MQGSTVILERNVLIFSMFSATTILFSFDPPEFLVL